jgi:hypothetical protein
MITPGTTPEHTFTLPVPTDNVKSVRIFYLVDDVVILQKETADVTMDGNKIKLTLTQEDTLKFLGAEKASVQLQVLSTGNSAFMSYQFHVAVGKSAATEVLT